MFRHSVIGPLVGLPLAALVVFGLFAFMQNMVTRDFVAPPPPAEKVLTAFTYKAPDDDSFKPRPRPVHAPDLANQPPPLPKFSGAVTEVKLPTPSLGGRVPSELPVGALKEFAFMPAVIDERGARPLRDPLPSYPPALARKGIQGDCDVTLDVDVRGQPVNISAQCSHSGFEREAERAVSRVQFAPKIVRGKAVERRGVVYPIEFRIDG